MADFEVSGYQEREQWEQAVSVRSGQVQAEAKALVCVIGVFARCFTEEELRSSVPLSAGGRDQLGSDL